MKKGFVFVGTQKSDWQLLLANVVFINPLLTIQIKLKINGLNKFFIAC